MKCERCGHELDNDDLFCSKCGKAVFEEYMDEDDIWEFYKSDEELKAMKMEAAAAADKDTEDSAHSVAAAAAAGYEKTDKVYVSENQREGMVPGMWMRKRQMR
ncbi:zinc ribbon domain-containing protein [Blautia sp. RD014234]|nr:zinc ribbon domain-containing protein [Blautia parvula]